MDHLNVSIPNDFRTIDGNRLDQVILNTVQFPNGMSNCIFNFCSVWKEYLYLTEPVSCSDYLHLVRELNSVYPIGANLYPLLTLTEFICPGFSLILFGLAGLAWYKS